jgi:parvulin-like peptidyl-prolyl isomerase
MKRHTTALLVFAAVAVAVAGCGNSGHAKLDNGDVAVVGSDHITRADFANLLSQAKASYKVHNQKFPKDGTSQFVALRSQLITFLVEKAEYQQKAQDLGIKVSDKQVTDRLEQIKKQNFASAPGQKPRTQAQIEQAYQQALKQNGLTDAEVRDSIKTQLLREAIYNKVTKDVKVSDNDAKTYYDKHTKQYEQPAQPESRDVRHILVKNRALAVRLYGKLKKNPSLFPSLARKYSTDTQTKVLGGKLPGGVFKGRTVPAFDKAAFSLKTNQISKPVHTQYGWHIIQALSAIRPPTKAKPTPFSQVKDALKQQLLQQKKQEKMTKWWNDTQKQFRHRIAYATGYAPPTTTSSATTTG